MFLLYFPFISSFLFHKFIITCKCVIHWSASLSQIKHWVELSSGPSRDLQYLPQVQKYYKAFYKRNIAVDILRYDQNLEAYDVILTPCLYQMRGDLAQRLEEYVRHGGTLVASVFSGIAQENDKVILGGYP